MGTGIVAELQDADKDEATLALESSQEGSDKGKVDDKGGKGEEGKTDEEKAAEAAEAALAERLKPVEKEDGSMETDEEAKTRVEAEDAAAAEPTETEKLTEEVRDLRQVIRTSKREMTQMQAKFERLSKKPVPAATGEEGEEELDEDGKPIKKVVKEEESPLSRVEELQEAIVQIGATKGASLDILLETMEQNEKYKDVREVCSRANFDDIFEAIASEVVKDKGGNVDEALLEVEFNTWNRANPYSYMYDLIKKYHPDFVEAALPGKKDEKKTPAKAPGSLGNLGGDSDIKSGWTAKRIDDLPEDELGTIPKEIYDKYMLGELA